MIKALVLILTIIVNAYAQELVASVLIIPNPAVNDRKVSGTLKIVQSVTNGPVTVTGTITGLNKEALHGFHVHAKGDLSEGCKSTGPHFNPEKVKHGAPSDTIRHVGDLGNIKSNDKGEAQVNITDTMVSLSGSHNIIGRAFVVHSQADDLGRGNSSLSAETGNAGERWACGVIGILSPEGSWPNGASSTHHVGFIFLLSAATYLIS